MIYLATAAVALILLGMPGAGPAQLSGKVPRVGWLTSSIIHEPNLNAFRDGMAALDYGEISIEFRAAAGHTDRLPALATELARLKPDVIIVDGGAAAVAAKHGILDIPIVVGAMADPVSAGIVTSLARPGGNITGFSITTGPELVGKRLDLLRQTVGRLTRVGVVWNESNPTSRSGLEDATAAAKSLGIAVVPLGVRDATEIGRTFADDAESRGSRADAF